MSDNIENKTTDDKKVGLRLHKPTTKHYDADEIREWFYNGTRKSKEMKVSDEAVRIINEMISDPEFDGHRLKETMQQYQDTLLNKQTVNLEHYANAIRFCSYLETNGGNATQAYIKTFKHRDFVKKALKAIEDDPDKGYESQDYMNIHAAACRYRKSPMVKEIIIQSEVPLYLLFQGYRAKLADKLVEIAMTAKAPRDRIQAINVFYTHIKAPENIQVDVNVNNKGMNDAVTQMEEMIKNMTMKQQELIGLGVQAEHVANAKDNFIEAEVLNEQDS